MERTIAEEYKNLEFIEEVTTNVDEVQKRVLEEILTRNANVEYLQRLNLDGHIDRETFNKVEPIITYEDIQSDINRITNGDKSPILCSQPVSEFLTSFRMSIGERKLILTTEEAQGRTSRLYRIMMFVVIQFVPDLGKGKGMYFMFIKSEATTPGGLLARPLLTSFYKTRQFRSNSPYTNYTSSIEAILCLDSYQSMYSQMLCGLCQNREVVRVGSTFASGFICAMHFLEDHWSLLCNDIQIGTINDTVIDPSVREDVMKILKPYSELVDFIEAECSNDSWQGIITRLWPNTKVRERRLYRYRVGNMLRVAGYKNNTPQFNFICQENVILRIDSDKTNEIELQNAVKNVENNLMPFDARVTEYTSYADIATIPGHYVLFWELTVNAFAPVPPSIFEDCCLTIEESLNSVYRQGRAPDKSIGLSKSG
ncbi:Indole-3-acetic acid-amido synthetase GH3.6 [Capsicum baccatum]|uniref:Indole-3-acetic acid-amido synthetase GH3.6 n=1 Tax=Capsicum baccatum TaxID=33114 RepID=A0A2G2VR15_CAPBA|nr:Indole-3-acetic acid-amido synthetase GH3.6 [Capsicum baccatum]